jgi:hypothetical protein
VSIFPIPFDYRMEGCQAMKYLCLIYDEEKKLHAMTKSEADSLMQEYFAFTRAIQQSGNLLGGNDLQPVQNATTVRVRGGKVSTTDGPFAETKEQLGGYFLLEAANLDEALDIAARWPSARFGSIEVRPVEEELRREGRYQKA